MTKLEKAKAYADAARERNKPPCACQNCRLIDLLPAVQRIVTNYSSGVKHV